LGEEKANQVQSIILCITRTSKLPALLKMGRRIRNSDLCFFFLILAVCIFLYAQVYLSLFCCLFFQVKCKMRMKNILKNRLALSTVVTTLIILVVSVLLAGVVTYFAINVTSTRVQEESLQLTMLHVWCPQTPTAGTVPEAAFLIVNTGGRDVVINKVTVRGQAADFQGAYTAAGQHPVYSGIATGAVTNDLTYISGTAITDLTTALGTGPVT